MKKFLLSILAFTSCSASTPGIGDNNTATPSNPGVVQASCTKIIAAGWVIYRCAMPFNKEVCYFQNRLDSSSMSCGRW